MADSNGHNECDLNQCYIELCGCLFCDLSEGSILSFRIRNRFTYMHIESKGVCVNSQVCI